MLNFQKRKFKISKLNLVLSTFLFLSIIFSLVKISLAATPNPGHAWAEVGDGTFVVSGPSTARTYTFPDANATMLTSNNTVTVAQGGTGQSSLAANNVILGNAANPVQFVAPGTAGNVLTSNGTTWVGQAPTSKDDFLYPVGVAPTTARTALVTNTSYFIYIGHAQEAYSTCYILARVDTAAATITWAEVGIFKGDFVFNGATSLTRVGWTNVATIYNTAGVKKTTVNVSGIAVGDGLWAAMGSQATTRAQVSSNIADYAQSGVSQSVAGRISTLATPVTTALTAYNLASPTLKVYCQ